MREDKLVIVVSRNYSNGLAVVRSLAIAGYTVDLIANGPKEGTMAVAMCSKYINRSVEVVSRKIKDEGGDPGLIEAIMEYAGKYDYKPLLFPSDDYTATILDTNRDMLSEYFLMPGIKDGGQGSLSALMDKTVQCSMAEELGLTVPVTVKVSLDGKTIEIPEEVKYPCFVKPMRSIEGYKTEMAVCDDEQSLAEHLRKLRDRYAHREVIVQEYLEIDQEYASAGMCFDQKVFLPALIRKTRIGKFSRGVTLTGELVPVDVIGEDNVRKAFELLRKLHYYGNFGLEFNLVKGKIYFNEVNLRSAGESFSYFRSGANFPAMFADEMYGIKEWNEEDLEFNGIGKSLIYDKIAWEDYIHEHITKEELDECINESELTILVDEDDPEPGDLFVKTGQRMHDRRIKLKNRRNQCILAASIEKGWDRERAEFELDRTRDLTGITYRDYKKYKFWNYNIIDQIDRYDRLKEVREIIKDRGTKKDPVVVVLSRSNLLGLSVVRALGEDGYTVDLVGGAAKSGGTRTMSESEQLRVAVEVVSEENDQGIDPDIIVALREYRQRGRRKLALIPADAYSTRIIDANRKALRRYFYLPGIKGGEQGDLLALMENDVQRDAAEKAGLTVRKKWTVDLRDEEFKIPEEITYPIACGLPEYHVGLTEKRRRCKNEEKLLKTLTEYRNRDPEREAILTEQYKRDYRIEASGVCIDQEVIMPAYIRKTRIFEETKARTEYCTIRPIEELGETADKIADMLRSFHYTGPFTITFNAREEDYVFTGLYFGNSKYLRLYKECGFNIPVVLTRALLGKKIGESRKKVKDTDRYIINESKLWRDVRSKAITKEQFEETLALADFTILADENDPAAEERFRERIAAEEKEWQKKEARRARKSFKKTKKKLKKKLKKQIRKIGKKYFYELALNIKGYPQGKRKNRRDPNSEYPRVLIAGRNWGSNLCMAKSVGEAGYEAEVLHIFPRKPKKSNIQRYMRPEKYSSFVKAYYALNMKNNDVRIVKRLLSIADPDRKMLLIPADDLVASTIDEYYYDLKDHYIMPTVGGKGGEISRLMSKEVQKDLARKAGLPVLNSCVISSEGGKIEIPDTVNYPCFIKPNISKNGLKTKMMRCDSEEELRAVLEARKAEGFEMLVEDFADIGRELSYLGLSTDGDGIVCPGYFEAVIGGEGSHRGVALLGRLLPVEQAEPLRSEVLKFIESLHYTGLFDVDLIETKDGTVYFVELNLRYGGSGFAITRAGVNLPGMYCDYMLKGKPLDMDCTLGEAGQTFVSEKVLLDEFKEGLVEFDDIEEIMAKADIHFTMDDADIKPFEHVKMHYETAKQLRQKAEARKAKKEQEEWAKERRMERRLERKLEERALAAMGITAEDETADETEAVEEYVEEYDIVEIDDADAADSVDISDEN